MSLISARNFSLPFTRRSHLITMVLVVLLFAILRTLIPTGAIGVAPEFRERSGALPPAQPLNAQPMNMARPAPSKPEAPKVPVASLQGNAANSFFDAPRPNAAPNNNALTDSGSSDVLGEILGNTDSSDKPAAGKPAQNGELDSVEKHLGLR